MFRRLCSSLASPLQSEIGTDRKRADYLTLIYRSVSRIVRSTMASAARRPHRDKSPGTLSSSTAKRRLKQGPIREVKWADVERVKPEHGWDCCVLFHMLLVASHSLFSTHVSSYCC
jgi:hypothetical protein